MEISIFRYRVVVTGLNKGRSSLLSAGNPVQEVEKTWSRFSIEHQHPSLDGLWCLLEQQLTDGILGCQA